MSIFGENLRRIRKERKLSMDALAEMAHTSKQVLSRYENGERTPKISMAKNIADALGIPLLDLMSDKATSDGMQPPMKVKHIPILGDTAAGNPIVANRVYDEYIDVPADGRHFDAAVRVTGDSMSPGYRIGDLALIHYQEDVFNGQIAVVCIGDEVTLKRVYHSDHGLVLLSDNPKYAPINVSTDDMDRVHLTGRAVGVIHWED